MAQESSAPCPRSPATSPAQYLARQSDVAPPAFAGGAPILKTGLEVGTRRPVWEAGDLIPARRLLLDLIQPEEAEDQWSGLVGALHVQYEGRARLELEIE